MQPTATTVSDAPPTPAPNGEAYTFPAATVGSGTRAPSRRTWITIGVVAAVVIAGSIAFVALRPAAPSASGAVSDYFADLASGDTTAALKLVANDGIASDEPPLLVAAALRDASSRPSDATVGRTTHDPDGDGATISDVTVTYKVGGHSVTQDIIVSQTNDKTVPYLLHEPFLELVVEPPAGLTVTVNGIALDPDTISSSGTPVFPGAYTATTDGDALLQSTTESAVYQTGDDGGVTARIEFGAPPLAANAQSAVQQSVNDALDTSCVNADDSFIDNCPITAPDAGFYSDVQWTIVTYPTIAVSPAASEDSDVQAQFTTTTAGAAQYTYDTLDANGVSRPTTGTVPIDVTGTASVSDSGLSIGFR